MSHSRICESVARVLFDGLLEVFDALAEALECRLSGVIAAHEIELVGLRVNGAGACQTGSLLRRDLDPNLGRDRLCHVAFERQNVAQVALVALRPQVPVARRMDQLRGDPHPVSHPLHGAFDDPIHTQLPRDLRQRLVRLLVVHHGCSRDHL